MKFSTKGRYGLRVMIDLAVNGEDRYIPLKDIAVRQGITVKYLEQIMPLLTKSGYVMSYRGNNGGYMLARKPEEYTAGDILRTTEGSLAPIACLENSTNMCPGKDRCITLSFWEGLSEVIENYVDSVTLADLVKNIKDE